MGVHQGYPYPQMGILVIKYRESFLPVSVKDCQILKILAKLDWLERVNNIFLSRLHVIICS